MGNKIILTTLNVILSCIMAFVICRLGNLTMPSEEIDEVNTLIYDVIYLLVFAVFMFYLLHIFYNLTLQYLKMYREDKERQYEQAQLLISTGVQKNVELMKAIEDAQKALAKSTSIEEDKASLKIKIENAMKVLVDKELKNEITKLGEAVKMFEQMLAPIENQDQVTTDGK